MPYLVEIAKEFNCSDVAISKALKKLNITRKKTTSYKKQCPKKVEKYLDEIKDFKKEYIIYIDETGIQGYIYREYARAVKDKKIYDKIQGKKYKRTSIVSGKCCNKIISALVYEKTMTSEFFEKCFKYICLNEV